MKRSAFLFVVILCVCGAAFAQQKPWSEWDKKEVDKMLNSSPWGQTQVEADTSEMTVKFGVNNQPDAANNQALTFNYRIRFFSARPIREAFARRVMLAKPEIKAAQLENFVIGDYTEMIVVAVDFDGADRRFTGPIGQIFAGARTSTIKNTTYLERKDGKRIEIERYAPPSSDGTGAKFVFPRMLNDKPFVSGNDDVLRFVADLGRGVKMSWRFKLTDMTYNGKIEY